MIDLRSPRLPALAGTLRTLRLKILQRHESLFFEVILIITLIFLPPETYSQEEGQSEIVTSIAEELAERENDPEAAVNFADHLRDLMQDPVKINSADEKEVNRLFFLTGFQVKILSDYVKTSGRITSVYEIANIPGFDRETAAMMLPFITLSGYPGQQHDSLAIHQTLLSDFIFRPNDINPAWPGPPWKSLLRYGIKAGTISAGFTMEKDQGEKLLSGTPQVPDFFSAYLSYRGTRFIKGIYLGDYGARFGQGIVFNTSAVRGYSLSAPLNLSGKDEIKQYTSADENNFLRGIAIVAGAGNSLLSILLSSNKIDATPTEPDVNGVIGIQSLYRSGYHNSATSILKKDILCENVYGLNLTHRFGNLNAGILLTCTSFSKPIVATGDGPASLYDFKGKRNTLLSSYYSLLINKFIFSGELASGGGKRFGLVQNIAFRPGDRLTVNFSGRYFSPGFITFHGRGPGISSVAGNEKGISGSFVFEAARFLFINAGTDLRIYPWLRYRCSAPSSAVSNEIRLKYIPSDKVNFEMLYVYRSAVTDTRKEPGIASPEDIRRQSARLQIRYVASGNLTITSRVDFKSVAPRGEKGSALIQDVALKFGKLPVTVWFRYCIFTTQSYDSGIYTWENDLLYSFSVPVLYGRGSRTYLLAKWAIGKKTEIRVKYGLTSAGAGVTETKYNDEFKFQLIVKL